MRSCFRRPMDHMALADLASSSGGDSTNARGGGGDDGTNGYIAGIVNEPEDDDVRSKRCGPQFVLAPSRVTKKNHAAAPSEEDIASSPDPGAAVEFNDEERAISPGKKSSRLGFHFTPPRRKARGKSTNISKEEDNVVEGEAESAGDTVTATTKDNEEQRGRGRQWTPPRRRQNRKRMVLPPPVLPAADAADDDLKEQHEQALARWRTDRTAKASAASDEEAIELVIDVQEELELIKEEDSNEDYQSDEQDDDVTSQERYDRACEILHKQLVEKKKHLTNSERAFLNQLLDEDQDEATPGMMTVATPKNKSINFDENYVVQKSSLAPDSSPTSAMAFDGFGDAGEFDQAWTAQGNDDDSTTSESLQELKKIIEKTLHAENLSGATTKVKTETVKTFHEEGANKLEWKELSESGDGIKGPPVPIRRHTESGVFDDEAADKYGVNRNVVLGNPSAHSLMTESLMEALRGFLPQRIDSQNYWLRFDSSRDEVSMTSVLVKIRASYNTIICILTTDGSIFGSFTTSPWRLNKGTEWYGAPESFLYRKHEGKMEVYPCTGSDNFIQYCSAHMLAVGGGEWRKGDSPYDLSRESQGIGLLIDGDLAGGETNTCATFANPRLSHGESFGNEFNISRMEIWTLTSERDEKTAREGELRKLFLEQTPPVVAAQGGHDSTGETSSGSNGSAGRFGYEI